MNSLFATIVSGSQVLKIFSFFFTGWQMFLYSLVAIVAWSLFEFITLTQRFVLFVVRNFFGTSFWYMHFFVSAFEDQIPALLWSILVDDFVEWLMNLDDTAHVILQKIRNCIIAICVGLSIRNLILKYLFWEVHQKKLSDRMKRFVGVESTLKYLYDRFVVREDDITEAQGYDGEEEDLDVKNEGNAQLTEEDETLVSQITHLTPIQILKHMHEFDLRQKSLKSGENLDFNIHTQADAIKSGKELFNRLDADRSGYVPIKLLEKVLTKSMSKALSAEAKPYLVKKDPVVTETLFEKKEEDLDIDPNVPQEFFLTESGLTKVFAKVFNLGESLSQVASAWVDLSSGLKAVCDAVLFFILMIVCAIIYGVAWQTLLVTTSATLVSVSAAFTTALQRLVLSLSFIFLSKPYEVGDCVAIEKHEPFFWVDSISVMTTQFRTPHNRKFMFPNWKLSGLAVYNLSRNRISKLDIFFDMSFDVPHNALKRLKRDIIDFFKKNADTYSPDFWFIVSDAYPGHKLVLQIRFGAKNAFEFPLMIATRKSDFLNFLRDKFVEHGITYKPIKEPVEIKKNDIAYPSYEQLQRKMRLGASKNRGGGGVGSLFSSFSSEILQEELDALKEEHKAELRVDPKAPRIAEEPNPLSPSFQGIIQ
jgi:small-conductance mechanosensitive channel